MRKLLRSIARHNMEAAGVEKMNKPRTGKRGVKRKSLFAENWRKWINEKPRYRRAKAKG